MVTATKKAPFSGLAGKLVASEVLTEEIVSAAMDDAQTKNVPLVRYLIENKLVASTDLAKIISEQFGIPLLDLTAILLSPEVGKLVSQSLIEKHNALPIYKHGKRVYVAIADPMNLHGLDEIKFNLGEGAVEPVLVEWDKLTKAIDTIAHENDSSFDELEDSELDDFDDVDIGEEEEEPPDDSDIDDAPVVKFVTKCLLDAI